MPYEKSKKIVPINYTSRDFDSIKESLVDHAKRYYSDRFQDFSEASFGSEMHHIQVFVENDSCIPMTKTGYRSEIFPMRVGKRLTKKQVHDRFFKMNFVEDKTSQLPLF